MWSHWFFISDDRRKATEAQPLPDSMGSLSHTPILLSLKNAFFSHLRLFGPFCHSTSPHSFLHFKSLQQHCDVAKLCCLHLSYFQPWFFFSTQACQTLTSQNSVASKKLHLFPWIYKLLACSHLSSAQAHAGMQITLWIHRPINDLNIKRTGPAPWPVTAHLGLN